MAQDFQVNGNTISNVEIANWEDDIHSQRLSLVTQYNQQRLHTWRARAISVANWETMESLRGQVISVTTTNHEDRNATDYRLYAEARIVRLTGEHVAEHMQDVEVEFLVI